jgi:hypothetical protein
MSAATPTTPLPDPTRALQANRSGRDRMWFAMLLLIVLASRLALLQPGFGVDPDGWAIANAARLIRDTGEYHASRPPGNPAQELICAMVIDLGVYAVPIVSTMFSVIAVGCFASMLRQLGVAAWFSGAAALAMTPIVYIHSLSGMDYVWALALILASGCFAIRGRWIIAGVALGFAIGCRITSGAMLVPICILLPRCASGDPRSWRRIIGLAAVTLAVGTLYYVPVLLRYGWAHFTFAQPAARPSGFVVLTRSTIHVWGALGFVAVVAGFAIVAARAARSCAGGFRAAPASATTWSARIPPDVVAAIVAIPLYGVAYIRLPLEAGYLIPIVPFAFLPLARWLPPRAFRCVCAAVCLSPFLLTIGRPPSGDLSAYSDHAIKVQLGSHTLVIDPWRGPAVREQAIAEANLEFASQVIRAADALDPTDRVIVGYWLPQIMFSLNSDVIPARSNPVSKTRAAARRNRFVYALSESECRAHSERHSGVYYLPSMAAFNLDVTGFDPSRSHDVRPLPPRPGLSNASL